MKRPTLSDIKPKSDLLQLDESIQEIYTAAHHIAGLEVWLSREWVRPSEAESNDPRRSRFYAEQQDHFVAKQNAVRDARAALDSLVSAWTNQPAQFVMHSGMGYMDDFYLSMNDAHFRDDALTLEAMDWAALSKRNFSKYYERGMKRRHDSPRSKHYTVLFTRRSEEWQARIPDLGERVLGHGSSLWEAWSACEFAWNAERSSLTKMPVARIKRLMDVPRAYIADAVFARLRYLLVEVVEPAQTV